MIDRALPDIATPAPGTRILHVVRQFLPNRGGLEDVVAHLCREQAKMDLRPSVLTLDRLFSRLSETLAPAETIDGIDVRRIPFRGSSRYPLAPSVFGHLGDADIVHVHGVDFFFDALSWGRLLHRKPLVATTHGGFFHTADHAKLKAAWFRGPTRLSAQGYRALAACSASDAQMFEQIAPGKVHLIENGVELSKFAGASSPVATRRLVTVGRFSKNKRPEHLIAMMANLAAAHSQWHLDMIGVASDWSQTALQEVIEAAGVARNVTLHLGLDDAAAAAVMRKASFFVSASDYEGFGLALIEALSAGLVPLVQPNAAFASLAQRHGSVRLVDFADPNQAANAIEAAYLDVSDRGPAAKPDPAELARYAWPRVAADYMAIYAPAPVRPQ